MNDDYMIENDLTMNDAEKIGEGLNSAGLIVGAIGTVILGIVGIAKLFAKDDDN